jgi:hypothetical protein
MPRGHMRRASAESTRVGAGPSKVSVDTLRFIHPANHHYNRVLLT